MSKIRNITKSLAVMEDLAVGRGTVQQKRGTGKEVDIHVVVESVEDLASVDTDKYTRARVYSGATYSDYTYVDNQWQPLVDNSTVMLKIFQSPTNGGLTEIQTRTVGAGEVYQVRKTSDDSLATIYSDAVSPTEILQNGTDNKSGIDGVVKFYIADGDYYVEVGGVKGKFSTLSASDVKLNSGLSVQDYADSTTSTIEDIEETYNKAKIDNNAVARLYSNTLIVGDSFLEGVGASTYADSHIYRYGRSFFNHQDNGTTNDNGILYETNANLLKAWSEVGLGSTGGGSAGISFADRGLCDKQLVIPSGDYIDIKLRELGRVGFFYDGTVTTASSATVSLNGNSIGSLTLDGTEIAAHSGFVEIPYGQNTEISDTVRITAVGGTLYISGFTTHKLSSVGGGLYIAPRGGWTFDDFNTPTKIEEMGKLINFNKSTSNRRLMVIALGTNSIYQDGGRNQTPTEYIASLDSLVTNMITVANNTTFVLTVPPKANPATYPVVNSNYSHENYRDAILDYAESKGFGVIRYDQTILGDAPYSYYSDGLHPNSAGHGIYAAKTCEFLQVPYNPYVKTLDFKSQVMKRFEQSVATFPGSGGAPTLKWVDMQVKVGRIVSVRLRNASGVEVPIESVRDLANSVGVFYQNQGLSATRFFYQNTAGFARNDGYYAATGILDGSSTGVTLVVDYI